MDMFQTNYDHPAWYATGNTPYPVRVIGVLNDRILGSGS
jgi:hypothetical protein